MSKADTLGPAPTFGTVRSARRNAINKVGGDDATAAITELPVTVISENPDNPRNHLRNLDETVESVRSVGIILPIVVGTVDAYLRDRPDRADDIDEGAQYVVVDGHRRLEASRRVGLATIPVRVDNARVATDETLLEAAFIANYHRDGMTDLEEAHALKQLVDHYGSQTKASRKLGIPQGTISSKLSLLKLAPELQKDLMTGERTVEHVRNLGKLSPEEQKVKADQRAEAARTKAEAQAEPTVERSAGPADYHGVIIPNAEAGEEKTEAPAPAATVAMPQPQQLGSDPKASGEAIPEPRHQDQPEPSVDEPRQQPTFPYDNPGSAAMHLERKTSAGDFFELVRILNEKALSRDPEKLKEIVYSVLGQAHASAE